MAYLLQPGLNVVEAHAVPTECATKDFMIYPQSTDLNENHREYQQTMLIGTAPFMALKGAPSNLVDTEDALRPQSTLQFNESYTQFPRDFPAQNVSCALPVRTMKWDPINTRAQLQNELFTQRYCKQ